MKTFWWIAFFSPASQEAVIHLESKYGNSAKLKLSTEKHVASTSVSDSVGYSNSKVSTRKGNFSEFLILGPDYPLHGVSAIIQEMNLRTSEDNRECRDYVQVNSLTFNGLLNILFVYTLEYVIYVCLLYSFQ